MLRKYICAAAFRVSCPSPAPGKALQARTVATNNTFVEVAKDCINQARSTPEGSTSTPNNAHPGVEAPKAPMTENDYSGVQPAGTTLHGNAPTTSGVPESTFAEHVLKEAVTSVPPTHGKGNQEKGG